MNASRQVVTLFAFLFACTGQTGGAEKPNVVLILADDLGWADVGCYGADLHETPQIDRLAREGLRFTDAYAMPVCSPTRATLMTGKHAARVHMTIWSEGSQSGPTNRKLLQAESLHDLPHSEETIAEYLHERGYLTAIIGKWHLGDADHYPETQGFDVNVGGTRWGAPQTFFSPYKGQGRFRGEFRYVPHLEFGKEGEYLTDRLTDEALNVLARAGDRPFFLYLAHHAVHTPIEAKPDDIAYFEKQLKPNMHHQDPVYAAMVKSLDDSVGRVLQALRDSGRLENTIFIFTSDNGGYIGIDRAAGRSVPVTNNHPLRSGKGSCYEGGVRVPLIIRWPGVTQPGTVSGEPVISMDLFHTLAGAAAVELPADFPRDGLDLKPVLTNPQTTLGREALYFHYPHYYPTTTPVSAVREGKWKLLEYFEDHHVELYDLEADRSESQDLAAQLPDQASRLRARLHQWREDVGAKLPMPNAGQ